MRRIVFLIIISCINLYHAFAQINSDPIKMDSSSTAQQLILKQKEDHKIDSIIRMQLQKDLANAKLNNEKKNEIKQKPKKFMFETGDFLNE